MITLYYYPSNASFAPHVILEEIGEPFTLSRVDRESAAHKSAAYLKLNPNGLIPVLVDGDLVLYESVAIALHLADTHRSADLAPAIGSAERAHYYKWLVWCTNTLQATLLQYFYPQRLVDEGDAAAAAQVKRSAETRIAPMLDQLDAHLAEQRGEWFLGPTYRAIDPFVLMLCRWTRNFARPARSLPHIGPYLERMLARSAVQRALRTENLVAPFV